MSFFLCFISPGFFVFFSFFIFFSYSFVPGGRSPPLLSVSARKCTAVNEKSQLLPKKSALWWKCLYLHWPNIESLMSDLKVNNMSGGVHCIQQGLWRSYHDIVQLAAFTPVTLHSWQQANVKNQATLVKFWAGIENLNSFGKHLRGQGSSLQASSRSLSPSQIFPPYKGDGLSQNR